MSSPQHCFKCATPFADDSVSGLCPACRSSTQNESGDTFTAIARDFPSSSISRSSHPAAATDDTSALAISIISNQFDSTVTGAGRLGQADTNDWRSSQAREAQAAEAEHFTVAARLPPSPPGYEVLRRLGGGGMGEVFLAREAAAERSVAMKFLHAPHNPQAVGRFLAEVRALARIDHPNIVRVHSTDFHSTTPYFVMEYVPGGTLADRVVQNGPLPAKEAASMVAAVARAVQAAHAADVLHRDLKPSNILIDANGNPKVADFGLAKRTDREDDLTLLSGPLGTPSFMPPEQVSSQHGVLGPTADVYALGATLYYVLSGRPPFTGDSSVEIASKVVSEPALRLRTIRPELPGSLEGIVAKCLEKAPTARYPSAVALAEDLDRFLAGEKQHAPELTRLRRSRNWVHRNRTRLGVGVVALILSAGLLFAGLRLAPVPKQLARPLEPLEEIHQELRAGRSVTLIGETGMPKYHRFFLEPSALSESSTADGTCAFRGNKWTALELLPDPGVECYRITAEVRQLSGQFENKSIFDRGQVGLYFGADSQIAPGQRVLTPMFTLLYSDGVTPPKPPPIPQQTNNYASFRVTLIQQALEHLVDETDIPAGAVYFRPAVQPPKRKWPGDWRRIKLEVTAEEVRVYWWESEKNDWVSVLADGNLPVASWTHEKTRSMLARFNETGNLGANFKLHDWKPRLGFGILADNATVSVRNVVVDPL